MAGVEIGSPNAIAALPRPGSQGKIWAEAVYTVSRSKKRKRSEVAIAIDGESVNVYDAQTSGLLTSYPVPPHTYFTSPPCSFFRRSKKRRIAQRLTYVSRCSQPNGKPEVVCFREDINQSVPQASIDHFSSHPTYRYSTSADKVLTIDVIPRREVESEDWTTGYDVLAVHEGGQVECLAGDLQTLRWERHLDSMLTTDELAPLSSGSRVEYATLTNLDEVRKGLLRHREDIVSLLEPVNDDQETMRDTVPLLFILTCPTNFRHLHSMERKAYLLSIRPQSAGLATSRRPALQELLSWRLPSVGHHDIKPEDDDGKSHQFTLHPSSGLLYYLCCGVLISLDLSGILPRITSRLGTPDSQFTSFVVLSPTLVIAASLQSCGVYDTKFNSLKASLPLSPASGIDSGKKQKRLPYHGFQGPVTLLTYFEAIDVVIGAAADALVAMRVWSPDIRGSKRIGNATSLADSIGKGMDRENAESASLTTDKPLTAVVNTTLGSSPSMDQDWVDQSRVLNTLVARGDVHGFEELFAKALGISLAEDDVPGAEPKTALIERKIKHQGDVQEQPLVNGCNANGCDANESRIHNNMGDFEPRRNLPRWKFTVDVAQTTAYLDRRKALYALGEIFRWKSNMYESEVVTTTSTSWNSSRIAIQCFPPNVFQWLLLTGSLSAAMVEEALRSKAVTRLDSHTYLTPRDIVCSLAEFDPELRLLHNVLHQAPYLGISEIVQAIKILCQSMVDVSAMRLDQPPTNGKLLTNGDVDSNLEDEEDSALYEIDMAFATLENGLYIRERAMSKALLRLYSFPAPRIVESFRDDLSQQEVLFLIQILRRSVEEGGWLLYYTAPASDDTSADSGLNSAITLIPYLMRCALDAIGMDGWLSGGSASYDDRVHQLLTSLKDETSWVVESTHECIYLRGLLENFLRFAKTTRGPRRLKTASGMSSSGRRTRKNVLLAGEGMDINLPLGLKKTNQKIPDTRATGRGQVKKRSARSMGKKISQKVPRYSVERIRI